MQKDLPFPPKQEINFNGNGPNIANFKGKLIINQPKVTRNKNQTKDIIKKLRIEPDFADQISSICMEEDINFSTFASRGLELGALFHDSDSFQKLKDNADIVLELVKRLPKKI